MSGMWPENEVVTNTDVKAHKKNWRVYYNVMTACFFKNQNFSNWVLFAENEADWQIIQEI